MMMNSNWTGMMLVAELFRIGVNLNWVHSSHCQPGTLSRSTRGQNLDSCYFYKDSCAHGGRIIQVQGVLCAGDGIAVASSDHCAALPSNALVSLCHCANVPLWVVPITVLLY